MAKKAKAVKRAAPIAGDEKELRRWCIEQAIRWPVQSPYAGAQQAMYNQLGPQETDILGRANRILAWVKT